MKIGIALLSSLSLVLGGCAGLPGSPGPGTTGSATPPASPTAAAGGPTRAQVQAEAIAAVRDGTTVTGFATPGPGQGGRPTAP
ncbi:MAG: DUF4148 domain-containing protein [Burkholderiaceae bacterium]|nr:DUF4148 domain-containing protein [Burkholderiaceae bacterium]